jgi:site-specific DNA-methyltransferase (adenine-specific)
MSTVTIHVGSNLDVLPYRLSPNSVDAIVTDPPYELGFMGKSWDASGIAYNVDLWKQCLRVLKPGGHLLAFSGSRTYHRMTCAIEDAGFEVRDQMMWVYGSGFPKSHNVGKALDKEAGVEREIVGVSPNWRDSKRDREQHGSMEVRGENAGLITAPATEAAKQWDGWGTALKPAHEPICVARKPLEGTVAENIRKWGVGGLNIDGCRVGTDGGCAGAGAGAGARVFGNGLNGDFAKPVPGLGRWPANLLHDGSQEVLELFPESKTGAIKPYISKGQGYGGGWGKFRDFTQDSSSGSAARFFYCPKASKRDRDEGLDGFEEKAFKMPGKATGFNASTGETTDGYEGIRRNIHPTVKPTDLMRYLCRLVTPPGGTVLDPFMGSGSTGRGAVLEGFDFIGVELSDEYATIAKARIDAALRK